MNYVILFVSLLISSAGCKSDTKLDISGTYELSYSYWPTIGEGGERHLLRKLPDRRIIIDENTIRFPVIFSGVNNSFFYQIIGGKINLQSESGVLEYDFTYNKDTLCLNEFCFIRYEESFPSQIEQLRITIDDAVSPIHGLVFTDCTVLNEWKYNDCDSYMATIFYQVGIQEFKEETMLVDKDAVKGAIIKAQAVPLSLWNKIYHPGVSDATYVKIEILDVSSAHWIETISTHGENPDEINVLKTHLLRILYNHIDDEKLKITK